MFKTPLSVTAILLAGSMLSTPLFGQQSSAPTTQTPPASASQPTGTPAAKPPATTKPAPTTAKKPDEASSLLKTEKDKASYAIGLNIGKSIQKDSVDVDPALIERGIKDGMSGAPPLLTEEETQAVLATLAADVRKHQQEMHEAAVKKNKQEGEAFLTANKDKPGVVTLPSGLQYKILEAGTGPKPSATDTVRCNYRGTLIDGTEFDSSYKRNQPATFAVNQVIKGWTEALQLMPVGSKWELFIPSNLAYGDRGTQGPIGPNETLIFEVELLSIQPKPEPKPAPANAPSAPAQAAPAPKPGAQPQTQSPTQPQGTQPAPPPSQP